MRWIDNIVIVGKEWNRGLVVERKAGNGRIYRKRLRNWYMTNPRTREMYGFTWGYRGTGPMCTAYSILCELFGEVVAIDRAREFMEGYVSTVPEDAEFRVTGDEICRMLSLRTARR